MALIFTPDFKNIFVIKGKIASIAGSNFTNGFQLIKKECFPQVPDIRLIGVKSINLICIVEINFLGFGQRAHIFRTALQKIYQPSPFQNSQITQQTVPAYPQIVGKICNVGCERRNIYWLKDTKTFYVKNKNEQNVFYKEQ